MRRDESEPPSNTLSEKLIGTFRRFGIGLAYKILRQASESHARVLVLESGEELDYSVADILKDPLAD